VRARFSNSTGSDSPGVVVSFRQSAFMTELRLCKYCGRPVAPGALKCPECGGMNPYPLKSQDLKTCGILFLAFSAVFLTCTQLVPHCNRDRKKTEALTLTVGLRTNVEPRLTGVK